MRPCVSGWNFKPTSTLAHPCSLRWGTVLVDQGCGDMDSPGPRLEQGRACRVAAVVHAGRGWLPDPSLPGPDGLHCSLRRVPRRAAVDRHLPPATAPPPESRSSRDSDGRVDKQDWIIRRQSDRDGDTVSSIDLWRSGAGPRRVSMSAPMFTVACCIRGHRTTPSGASWTLSDPRPVDCSPQRQGRRSRDGSGSRYGSIALPLCAAVVEGSWGDYRVRKPSSGAGGPLSTSSYPRSPPSGTHAEWRSLPEATRGWFPERRSPVPSRRSWLVLAAGAKDRPDELIRGDRHLPAG
jgi:hypothetical protein